MASSPTNALPWVDPFCKILDLEEAHSFDNKAVVGGLDRFIERWAASMTAFAGDPRLVHELVRVSYGEMSPAERGQWAARWRTLLAGNRDSIVATTENRLPSNPTIQYHSPPAGLTVDAPVDRLRGVDTKLTSRLKRLGVSTVRDLLYLFPRRHVDYSKVSKIAELEPGQNHTVIGQLWEAREVSLGQQGKLKATEAVLSDETGNIKVTWFGQGFLARTLKPNSRLAVSGKVDVFRNQLVFESPEYEVLAEGQTPIHTTRLVPVYPLTEGLTARNLRRLTWQALSGWLGGVEEIMPTALLSRTRLMALLAAIQQAHYPDNGEFWAAARRRLAFDELLVLQLAVLSRRRHWNQGVQGVPIEADSKVLEGFIASLPFSLTGAQRRCVGEILVDMERGTPPMNRLLQGEVGSGKTVVVLAALLAVAAAGYQGSIMVPTEVLAEQHFQTVSRLLGGLARPVQEDNLVTAYLDSWGRPVSVGLLTGSTRPKVKRELTQMAAEGNLDLLIGTHALIQSGVEIPKLALAVMDEQHRFGVLQRSALRQKSVENPHILVMSATPIPRTLSLTLYGDLDISTIDELPPGRQEIQTKWLGPERRQAAYGFVRKQVQEGRQAFIIYPLIDESEAIDAKAATEEYQRLSQEVFSDLRLGLLHGRMSSKDKDQVMRQFRDGVLDILVSTAVVEVGIDVANATVMLIEGADRFGLSQLHQFRGRVGRGEHKSYCILLSDSTSEVAKERLSALERIHDGFQLAEVDLELRGPGDFFGTRQSGLPDLRMAHISDRELLALARKEATRLMEQDPELAAPEHAALAAQVARFLDRVSGEFT
jgi:ATP-dependent DNA helicase RecG